MKTLQINFNLNLVCRLTLKSTTIQEKKNNNKYWQIRLLLKKKFKKKRKKVFFFGIQLQLATATKITTVTRTKRELNA